VNFDERIHRDDRTRNARRFDGRCYLAPVVQCAQVTQWRVAPVVQTGRSICNRSPFVCVIFACHIVTLIVDSSSRLFRPLASPSSTD
jgi:hypothetical protein